MLRIIILFVGLVSIVFAQTTPATDSATISTTVSTTVSTTDTSTTSTTRSTIDSTKNSPKSEVDSIPSRNQIDIRDDIDQNPCPVGECTPYYLCLNGTIIDDGASVLDVRFGEEDNPNPMLHPCKGLFQTCCTEKSVDPVFNRFEKKDGCGHRNSNGVGFEISHANNLEAQFAEFPWTVAILENNTDINASLLLYQCGGSLIHPNVVLTAAHCVYGKDTNHLIVRAGEWDTNTQDEPYPRQDLQVDEIIIHEQFYKNALYNDVALLYLKVPFTLMEHINTVCLPPQGTVFDGSHCFASGWGRDRFGQAGRNSVIMKKIDLPIVPRDICLEKLRDTRLGIRFKLHGSFICAGGEVGKDTCTGDGGSPLVCPINGKKEQYYQSGIVSWGIGCSENTPVIIIRNQTIEDTFILLIHAALFVLSLI